MRITGIATCVGEQYAAHLAKGIERWADGLDKLIVVTAPGETDVVQVVTELEGNRTNISLLEIYAFWLSGAYFNKAAAIQVALGVAKADDWILLFDADVVPPEEWRDVVHASTPSPHCIYGAHRVDEEGRPIPAPELGGYFHLWHSADPAWTNDPTLGSWATASGYDSAHLERWPPERRLYLPLTLTHYGPTGENWLGPGTGAADVAALQERRQAAGPGSWRKERLDR